MQAQTDLNNAYSDINGRANPTILSSDIGGTTLTPGLYHANAALSVNGIVTLDAQGDPNAIFVIQAMDSMNIASGSQIRLIGSAQACNVFWQSNNSVFLGSNSINLGNFIAANSISLANGALLNGRALSRNGSVSLDTNTISVPVCTPQSPLGTLRVITNVINNNGGNMSAASFTVRVRLNGNFEVPGSPANGMISPGLSYSLTGSSTYVVTVDSNVYPYATAQFGTDCSAQGSVYLPVGAIRTCTITLDDIAPIDVCPYGDFSPNKYDGHCVVPVIAVVSKAIPAEVPFAGSTVTYTYTISNPGRVALSNVDI